MPRVLPTDIQNDLKSLLAKKTPYSRIAAELSISKGTITIQVNGFQMKVVILVEDQLF